MAAAIKPQAESRTIVHTRKRELRSFTCGSQETRRLVLLTPARLPLPFFFIDSRGSQEQNSARAEWTEVGSYACMRLETFGESERFT
jgi:hypothetical protein